jgi:DNA uptake protein ComE-like DNA-binding protein
MSIRAIPILNPAWKSRLWQWSAGIGVIGMGSASFVGALLCLNKAILQGPPHVYLPVDDTWQEAWQENIVAQASPDQDTTVTIEVSGAVEKPGVFQLSSSSRVQEAILQAGGFSNTADLAYIHQDLNLASKLSDQEKIYIPFQGESSPDNTSLEKFSSQTPAASKKTLNTATEKDFQEVSGIGEVRAKQIIAGQPYSSREDFLERSQLSANLANVVLEIYGL